MQKTKRRLKTNRHGMKIQTPFSVLSAFCGYLYATAELVLFLGSVCYLLLGSSFAYSKLQVGSPFYAVLWVMAVLFLLYQMYGRWTTTTVQ